MANIFLWNIIHGKNRFSMIANLAHGVLTLNGLDTGEAPEQVWGSDCYEYIYKFDAENTEKLFQAIAGGTVPADEEACLKALADWNGGTDTDSKIRDLCNREGIKYSFFSGE